MEETQSETYKGTEEYHFRTYGEPHPAPDSMAGSAYECYLTRVPVGDTPDYTEHETLILSGELCSSVGVYLILETTRHVLDRSK